MKKPIVTMILCISILVSFSTNALAYDIEAGPIWNNADAQGKCPATCSNFGAGWKWNGNWVTTVPGKMSVCGCDFTVDPEAIVQKSIETCSTNTLYPTNTGSQAAWTDGQKTYGSPAIFGDGVNQLLDENIEHKAGKQFCEAKQQRWFTLKSASVKSPYMSLTCCTPPSPGQPTYNANMSRLLDAAVDDHNLMKTLQQSTTTAQLIDAAKEKGFPLTIADVEQSKGCTANQENSNIKRSIQSLSRSSCGGIDQSPCSRCTDEVCVYWPFNFCCIKESCSCQASSYSCSDDLSINPSGICDVNRSDWQNTPIDNSRNQAECGNMNCWKYDDSVRDKLEMDTSKLNYVTQLKGVSRLPVDGRYIYVYRKSDNNIYIRNYDRNESDKKWMYPGNCRERTDFGQYSCTTSGNQSGRYLHVRHSQLNGGWEPIWCGGEMRIEDGKICMANNESGHFKPDKRCLSYVKKTLQDWGLPVASDAVFDDFRKVSASNSCSKDKPEF
jgi:hypothetical protein